MENDFGIKYDLGDIVTMIIPEYELKFLARIVRITQKAQNNQTQTTIEIGQLTTIKR